jgi:Tol biopolymer transport system component
MVLADHRLTADARWVAFSSTATNLVAGVTNLHGEIYLRDRQQGTTRCPSDEVFENWSLPEGSILFQRRAFSPFLSEDGVFLSFIAEVRLRPPTLTPMLHSLWRYEIATGQATLVSTNITLSTFGETTIYSTTPDGRWLAYQTATTDHQNNIELWDGDTGVILLATVALDGSSGAAGFCDAPELSADGRFLVFTSNAGNLVTNLIQGSANVFVRDTVAASTELISQDPRGTGMGGADLAFPGISHDGAWVVFDTFMGGLVPDDLNLASDVFLRDRESGVTELVSRADPTAQSASGNGHSSLGVAPFSEDGGRLLFRSESGDLAPGASPGIGQVYVHDAASAMNTLASVNFEGDGAANAWCSGQVISSDGRTVIYTSAADNLAAGDGNNLKMSSFMISTRGRPG